ncbi:glutathione ABC transporter substrate-binding protein [Natronincola ferrireducens]|nr:glutathione ABC transporter substrate-binding protein [Natronincola ferrireducens]
MMKKKNLIIFTALLMVITLIVTGCGGKSEDAPVETKPLIIAQRSDAVVLDPHANNDQASSRVMRQIYSTLVNQNEDMELQPGLAESWEAIDELTFEFKLRQGVKFHNGEELTADDVAFTLKRALGSSHVSHIVGAINPDGIVVIDPYTIRIATNEPFAPLLAHLAHTATGILNEKAVTEAGEDYSQYPVGTGPYKLENWVVGETIELVRFEDYYDESNKAKIEKVIFKAIAEDGNRTIELETEGIDIAYDIIATDVDRVANHSDLEMVRDMNLATTYVGFNAGKEPFNDVRVRQAINYAVDMDLIVEVVYLGTGEPSRGPLGGNVWASNQNLKSYGYDVEKAKELMKEAGLEDGFKTTIWTNQNQQRIDIAEILQNQLKDINIEAEVSIMDWGAYLEATAAGEHDMFILGWVTVTGDPDYGLYPLFHSKTHGDAGNRTFYTNERVDELLDLARVNVDPATREAAYMEVQEIVRNEAPWIFTWTGEELTGIRNNVKGFKNHPAGHHELWTVYFE